MKIKSSKKNNVWVVYILRCSDKSLYTGITNNIEKRFAAHNQGTAAKYTRSRRPVKLLLTSAKMDRISAMRLEIKIKRLPKEKKLSALKKHTLRDHGYETPKQALETNSATSCGVLYPPLCGIVQLTNSAALRLRNWSFTNKKSKSIICQECPNGCNLILKWKDASNVFIAGNKCASGISYATHLIRKNKKAHIHANRKTHLFSRDFLKAVAEIWNVKLKILHRNIPIQGSPERSIFRVVLEDRNGRFFVLEQIHPQYLEHKKQIAATLDFLVKENLARVQSYLADEKGNHVIKYKNDFWQISPFVQGDELNRGKYIYEKWRGHALAAFIIELRRKSQGLSFADFCGVFSLKNYVYKLTREINLYNKDIRDEIKRVVSFLEKDFMPVYEKLPVAFCQGDYHPLNVIWFADNIKCVIDWEFCGFKSELYDAANLIGCIGVEDPQSLMGDLVKSFIADLKKAKIIYKKSWKYLVEFIVALRFAWLAEWLRRKDTEMIRLELDYMRLLIDNKNILQKAWL